MAPKDKNRDQKRGYEVALIVDSEKTPLHADADGVWRVGGTRITLDSVIMRFREGATAEEIVQRYPSMELADVYLVVAFYLRHQASVDEYLAERAAQADEVERQNTARWSNIGLRERLLARKR